MEKPKNSNSSKNNVMNNRLPLLICLVISFIGCSQTPPKIENYPFGALDVRVMVMPFGMEQPIEVGQVPSSGTINFNFPKEIAVSTEMATSESSKLCDTLFSQCDYGMDMVSEEENVFSFDAGFLSLWTSDNRYVGVIFTVSNEELLPWVEDPAYMDPIIGSYYKLIYVSKPVNYKEECIQTKAAEDGDVQVAYSYDLQLKQGFNFLEYKIEHIYKTDPNIMASFPDKVSVKSVENIPTSKWIGKYF